MNPPFEQCLSSNHRLRNLIEASIASQPLVVLVGPTAIGKSRIAVEVAQALGTEILTADSTQVYRGMNIGTDTPSEEERQGVPHRLIDLVEPDEPFNAGEFRRQALPEISRLYEKGLLPLVVGGTGLYVRALLHGLWSGPPSDHALRGRLEEESTGPGGGIDVSGIGTRGSGHGASPASARYGESVAGAGSVSANRRSSFEGP